MTPRRYPVQPLLDATGLTLNGFIRRHMPSVNGQAYRKARNEGLSMDQAERWALTAGWHPFEVWPNMADHQLEDQQQPCEECGEPFLPTRKGHRFCSSRCRTRVHKRRQWATSETHREKRRAYLRQYRQDAARVIARQKREWVEANRDRVRESNREAMRRLRARRQDAA